MIAAGLVYHCSRCGAMFASSDGRFHDDYRRYQVERDHHATKSCMTSWRGSTVPESAGPDVAVPVVDPTARALGIRTTAARAVIDWPFIGFWLGATTVCLLSWAWVGFVIARGIS